MTDQELELFLTPAQQSVAFRTCLARALTSVGSSPEADIQLAGMPARWVLVRMHEGQAVVQRFGESESFTLVPGQPVVLDGVRLEVGSKARVEASSLPLEHLSAVLSSVESPEEALASVLRNVMQATGADRGAVVLREGGDYSVAVAEDQSGAPLPHAEQLLSDTLVREVLGTGTQMWLPDVAQQSHLAQVPSIVALQLRSLLCVPMQLSGTVLGAIFLGKTELTQPFTEVQAKDLSLVASLAVPVLVQLRRLRPGTEAAATLVGECRAIQQVQELIHRVASSDLSVLVLGDTGTGKELVARALHAGSGRSDRPLVAINCASVPRTLLEAELFGYKRGAFTGAVADRKGRIEAAHHSTLFLDEVGDMPLEMQAALLRVLENQEVTRVGENQTRHVDFRLVTATHKDLGAATRAGAFRPDLLYRLKEFTIQLPPLAERGADILLLAQLFLHRTEQQLGLPGRRLGNAAAQLLMKYPWPGNVRELRATMRRAAILCEGREIRSEHLRLEDQTAGESEVSEHAGVMVDLDRPLAEARDDFVTRYVQAVLARHKGHREAAATALQISLRSLYRYLSSKH